MNVENRATKVYIKELPTLEALQRLNKQNLPSPYHEILVALINRKEGYPALDYLEKEYNIYLGYWTYTRRLKEALQMFRKNNKFCQ